MGPTLKALVKLQVIELDLCKIRRRRKAKGNAVATQEKHLAQIDSEKNSLTEIISQKRVNADELDLTLKQNREKVEKYRGDLNAARTNKEYAAILTQINSQKASDAKIEEQALAVMSEIEELEKKITQLSEVREEEAKKLETLKESCKDDIEKLDKMIADLSEKREEAAKEVPADELHTFERLSERFDGEAMAAIEISGKKPNITFSCTGCYMSLNAEHVNALRSNDIVRMCDSCGRILYLSEENDGYGE